MDEVDSSITLYKEELARLISEVESLERKKERLEWLSIGAISYQQLCRATENEENLSIDENVLKVKNQLSMLTTATGVSLKDVTVEPCDEDGSCQYVLKGSSCNILFEIKFQEKNDGYNTKRQFHISNVEIDSMENINTGLKDLLDLCEDQSSLGLFFSVFVPYVRCLSNRREAFICARKKFPELVDFSHDVGGDTLKFRSVNQRILFQIKWSVSVDQLHQVIPVLQLTAIDGEHDCEMFNTMVSTMGPSRAVDAFLTSVCGGLKHE